MAADADRPTVVYVPGRPRLTLSDFGVQKLAQSLLTHRGLIFQLSSREIAARYRGSILGVAWSFLNPIMMLVIYTFVFTVVFQARWEVTVESHVEFALILFAGLIVFNIFAECIGRAPMLVLENVSYVKRIVFPLEIMGWVALLSALFNAGINIAILIVGFVLISGSAPPATIVLLPLVLAPFCLLMLGLVWIFAALGVYVRDLRQIVAVILPIFMFASPLFYPVSAVPEGVRNYLQLNPLAVVMEQVRAVVLFGSLPDLRVIALYTLVSVLVAWFGLAFFLVTKRGFADVL